MDRILQEISAVGRKLEGMDNAMVALMAETRSMRLEIAGFQSQIWAGSTSDDSGSPSCFLDQQRPGTPAPPQQANRSREQKPQKRHPPSQNPGRDGGPDIPSYLRDMLPKLTEITFDPPLEFQRAHRLGPKRKDGKGRPRPIIACMLRHGQARQLLQTA
ncbi:hypothetical protein NDU88_004106 [Pleurodeles waltl]|uniref:Uncharacterized protein n=1 Tax=Pleurodeles waltl TaxID=8319 RepID=A0AAV7TQD1_PLEWA|nr:hypothetical protein NDU88_004106 [Pleurodeles waltl]